MPRVPMQEQDVLPGGVSVPVPKFAQPVKEGFTAVADANAELAGTVSNIAGNEAERQMQQHLWDEQARVYDSRERLANDITDMMTNNETETVVDAQGNPYDRPIGYLNRAGYGAQGSAEDFQKNAMAKRDDYLNQFTNPHVRAQAARWFDSAVSTGYRQVANHEAKQVREAQGNSFLNSAINESKNATLAGTPEELTQSLDNVHEAYFRYGAFKGMDPESIQKGLEPMMAKAVQNSTMNMLRNTGDVDKAKELLDSVQQYIPNDYKKIAEELDTRNGIMQRQIAHQEAVKKVDNAFQMIGQFAEPGSEPPSALDVAHMAATHGVDDDFATAYTAAMKSFDEQKAKAKEYASASPRDKQSMAKPTDNIPNSLGIKDSEEMDNFAEYIRNVMQSEDKKGITGVLTAAMNDAAKGRFSQDKMKILCYYALQRGGLLDSVQQETKPVDPALLKMDGGMQSLLDWSAKAGIKDPQLYSDYMDAVKKNVEPKEATETAMKNAVLKADPTVATLSDIPVSIKRGAITSPVTFKKGTKWYPKAILQEKANESGTAR